MGERASSGKSGDLSRLAAEARASAATKRSGYWRQDAACAGAESSAVACGNATIMGESETICGARMRHRRNDWPEQGR